MTDPTPIEVNASPLPDQLWAAIRQAAPPIMAFALGKQWISNDVGILLGALGAIVWPIVAGQMAVRERARQLRIAAHAAPDNVAKVV